MTALAPAEITQTGAPAASPLPPGVSAGEVAAQCLLHTAEREVAGIHSVLVGQLFMLVVHWGQPTLGWVLAAIVVRFFVLTNQLWVTRRIKRIGAQQALAEHLDRRLVWGLATGGAAWGLLSWAVGPVGHWALRDELTVMMLLVTGPLTLITTSYLWQGMLAFNVGLWGHLLLRVLSDGLSAEVTLALVSLGFLMVVLYVYGRQLHCQTRAGVIANLQSQSLRNELSQANRQLVQALNQAVAMATHDPLTQTPNRRAFLDRAEAEASAMSRHGQAACVLMLDLDEFKLINDRHGHAVGDATLVACADAAQALLRGADVMARWGGEEFIVLLPRTDTDHAAPVAERMRLALQTLHTDKLPENLKITASIGLARWLPGETIDDAIARADAALYTAKARGRNRVQVWLHGDEASAVRP